MEESFQGQGFSGFKNLVAGWRIGWPTFYLFAHSVVFRRKGFEMFVQVSRKPGKGRRNTLIPPITETSVWDSVATFKG